MSEQIKLAAARILYETEQNSVYSEEQLKTAGTFLGLLGAGTAAASGADPSTIIGAGLGGYGGGVAGSIAGGAAASIGSHTLQTLLDKAPDTIKNNPIAQVAAKYGPGVASGILAPKAVKKLRRWYMEDDED